MNSKISQLAVAALFSLTAVSANAAPYSFYEYYSGFLFNYENYVDNNNKGNLIPFQIDNSGNRPNFTSADTKAYSDTIVLRQDGTFTSYAKNNIGTLYGTFSIAPNVFGVSDDSWAGSTNENIAGSNSNLNRRSDTDRLYYGVLTYTGGTGLFEGATGNGYIMSGMQRLVSNGSAWGSFPNRIAPGGEFTLSSTITSAPGTAPVPEADTSAMLLMGAGVMGFMARRRKNTQA